MKTYICGCVKSCEPYIDSVFKNIDQIIPLFEDYKIVIAYDKSQDKTLRKLCDLKQKYNMDILINPNKCTQIRVQNICTARNQLLQYMRKDNTPNFDFFVMMDFDDACSEPMNISALKNGLERDDWDSISFNRKEYYDVWALSTKPYVFSCWHFSNGHEIVKHIQNFIKKELGDCPPGKLYECISAFNGLAVYRTSAFENINYEWDIKKNIELMPEEWITQTARALGRPILRRPCDDDCEHRYFHIKATQLNGARIRISPECLF
jgi:hypothetical protein